MTGLLSDAQITNVLSSQVVGRLACTDGTQPYIIPLTYAYDGKYIYSQTNDGKKLKMLRKNPAICFEVDIITNITNWQSVIAVGTFEELGKSEAEKARCLLFNQVYPMQTPSTVKADGEKDSHSIDDSTRIRDVMYRIMLKNVTGRFEKK